MQDSSAFAHLGNDITAWKKPPSLWLVLRTSESRRENEAKRGVAHARHWHQSWTHYSVSGGPMIVIAHS